jgi:hypothetical protein
MVGRAYQQRVFLKQKKLDMKSIMIVLLALGLSSCFEARPTLKDLTIKSFEKRHNDNMETLSILCPTIDGVSECLQRYSLDYRLYEGKKYLYEIKYK